MSGVLMRSLLSTADCETELARFNCSSPTCSDLSTDNGGYFNYIYNQYCVLGSVRWLGWGLLLLWFGFLIYLLSDTADAFFCPALDVIVDVRARVAECERLWFLTQPLASPLPAITRP